MQAKRNEQAVGADSAREVWVKLILLVVALVSGAGYALALTNIGAVVRGKVEFALHSASVVVMAVAALALAAAAAAFVVSRRWSKGGRTRAEGAADRWVRFVGREDFLARLAGEIESHAKSDRQLAVHLIDVDRFHLINEMLGEAEGDKFLQAISERLSILVDQPGRLARIGDDEFALVQPETGGVRHAEIFARRIQDALKDVCAQVPRHARPGASIGVAVSPDHGVQPLRLLHCASLAIRSAKSAGGGAFRVYSRDMEMAIDARLQMEKAISDGLHHGHFELHFQPQYDLQARRLTGFEALVRMRHPELGELLPAAFLPVAEESGLIQSLGDWIAGQALAIAAAWPNSLTLAINVSAVQFRSGDVATGILQALSRSGFPPARLRVEVSEAVLTGEMGSAVGQLRRLRRSGATIVLDDFGVDGSNLKALSQASFDAVKIDRTFVVRVGEDPEAAELVQGLIGTARSFGLAVCGEGVERPEQALFLMANACQNVQGFLFGRPVPAKDVAAIIAKDARNAEAAQPTSIPRANAAA